MNRFNIADNIIVRQPLNPAQKLLTIPKNKSEMNQFYRSLYNDKAFKEALFLGSPELYYEWIRGIDSETTELPNSILKYYIRSFSNTVPFGLFGSYSKLPLQENSSGYTRYSNIDMDFVIKLTTILNKHAIINNCVELRVNNTIYQHNKKF
jgi:hypothetical protein